MFRTCNRRAVTLTEVLIAIFLMGIGLMAILSLFPLGAAQMAQAIQDQRAAEAATTASAFARTIWKEACDADGNDARMKFLNVDSNAQTMMQGPSTLQPQPFVLAMDSPNGDKSMPSSALKPPSVFPLPMPPPGAPAAANTPSATGPSYPVLVDPIGWQAQANVNNTTLQWWMANQIPRRTLGVRQSTGLSTAATLVSLNSLGSLPMQKQFALMDDMTFDFNGAPKGGATSAVERQGRYSWAYLFRRNNNADRTSVDISTILYSGRSLDVAATDTMFGGTGNVGSKALALTYSGNKPTIRRGGWVLDGTIAKDDTGVIAPQGIFYRAVNVDDSVANQLTLELQTPLLGGPSGANQRAIIIMDKVVEVFVKKDVTNVAPAMPY